MKKLSTFLTSAALLAAFTFGAIVPADAAVFTPGPQDLPSLPGNGFPKWYSDPVNATPPPVGGISLLPCISQTVSPDPAALGGFMCILLPDIGFIPTNPVAFPGNFPPEFFYFIADARILDLGGVNGDRADYRAALEGTFSNGVTALNQQITFARVSFTVDAAVSGTYRITHPFGQQTFANVVAGQAAIRVQEDIGIGAPGGPFATITTPVGAASQAGGGLQQFLVRAVGGVPSPITVGNELFIGDPNVDQLVVGATQADPANPALRFNAFMVERDVGGVFVQVGRTDNFALAGQIIALTLAQPADGTDFGVWKINTPSTAKTFTLQNLSPAAVTPVISAIIPNSNNVPSPDFSIVPSTCGAAVAAGASCTFDVIFTPVLPDGVKNATITVSGGASVPPVQTTVSGTGDGTPPNLTVGPNQFTNTLSATISGAASDNILVHDILVDLGLTRLGTSTVANGTWSFVVSGLTPNAPNVFTVSAVDTALPAPGNTTTLTTTVTHDNIPPVVAITSPVDGLTNNTTLALAFAVTETNPAANVIKVDGTTVTPAPATLGPLADGRHTVTVEATDSAGNLGTHTNTFTVDTIPPAITVTSPKIVNNRLGVRSPALTFSVTDANNVPANTLVTLDTAVVPAGTATIGPFAAGTNHTLTVVATDGATNSTTTTLVFTIVLADGRIVSLGASPPTIADALMALRHTVQLVTLTGDSFAHADVAPLDANGIPNPNGTVDISDALIILRKIVGLITTF